MLLSNLVCLTLGKNSNIESRYVDSLIKDLHYYLSSENCDSSCASIILQNPRGKILGNIKYFMNLAQELRSGPIFL